MLHMVKKVLSWIISLICVILRCKRRKVKEKDDESFVPMEVVVDKPNQVNFNQSVQQQQQQQIVSNINPPIANLYNNTTEDDVALQDWNSWGNTENQHAVIDPTMEANEPGSMNFFQDMEPSVKVKKVYIKKQRRPKQGINMLNVKPEDDIKLSADLAAWDDAETEEVGWEEEDIDINCDQIAAEAKFLRMQERKQRSEESKRHKQMKKQQAVIQNKLGMKVS